jgi:uncharacterized membrane protein
MILLAVLLVTPALTILLGGIVGILVRSGMRSDLAAVVTGGVTLIVGVLLLIGGFARIKTVSFIPTRALEQLSRDLVALDSWGTKP